MDFYKNNFKLDSKDAVIHKERYIRNLLENNMLYKFISFTDNDELNNTKLKCMMNDTVWMSHYNYFEDVTELKIPIDKYQVSQNTNRTVANVEFLIDSLREIYDICCFTHDVTPYMWENYANESNGICLCFNMLDCDKYFPVEYIDKKHFDLTKSMIKSVNDNTNGMGFNSIESKQLSTLPLVMKDKKYKKENEIRLLTSPFDDENEVFGGIVSPGVKNKYDYSGTEQPYADITLQLIKVIIGDNCTTRYQNRVVQIMESKNITCVKKI